MEASLSDSSADFPGTSLIRVILSIPSKFASSSFVSTLSHVNLFRFNPVAFAEMSEISWTRDLIFTTYSSYSETWTSLGADHALIKHFKHPTALPGPILLADSALSISSATYSLAALV